MRIFVANFGSKITFRCGFNKNKYNMAEHIHQFAEIAYCTEGSLEIIVDGKSETMNSGDMAIIPPYKVHSYSTRDYVKRWICVFSDNFIPNFVTDDMFLATPEKYVFRPDQKLIDFLKDKLPDNKESSTPPTSDEIASRCLIIACIYEDYLRKAKLTYSQNDNTLSAILIYIRKHFRENITLSSIGNALGYSPKYISNCISKIKNYTFPLLINSLRIDYAKELLINTDTKIIDIGAECGYKNEKTFYRAFRSITNTTPKDYRLQKKQQSE